MAVTRQFEYLTVVVLLIHPPRHRPSALVKHRIDCFDQMLDFWPALKPLMDIAKDRSDDIGNLADFVRA